VGALRAGTPERLIEAAQAELIQGNGALEMQAVAKRAKVSVGLAYHHFGSKAGLIAAVVQGFYDRLEEVAFNPATLASTDWACQEKQRLATYIAFYYDHPLAPVMVGQLSRAPEVLDVELAFTNRQLIAGANNLRIGRHQGVIARSVDPRLTIALMIGGVRQALMEALTQRQRPDRSVLTERIWIFISGALRLPPGSGCALSDPVL